MLLAMLLTSCATHKNTASTRWWKSFKSRYNTYFNGHQAYLEGMQAKAEGNKDNFTDFLPLMMVSNKSSKDLGKGNFETTITKCEKTIKLHSIKNKPEYKRGHRLTAKEKAFRNRKEFNPFLKNAWILMGKAQLQRGEYIEAASTFAYTERLYRDQPQVANIARSLAALCYTQLDWFYDAEDLLNKVRRDSVPRAARRPYNTALTNLHLRQKHWKEALPYLKQEVSNMPHGIPRARGYYLLAQVYQTLNMKKEAYKSLQKCLNQSPPYEMKFNAQIMQTEVMLMDSVKKLGKSGEIVKVAPGYARNYLIPKGLAAPVTEAAKRRLKKLEAERAARAAEEKKAALEVAKKLDKLEITVNAHTTDGKRLYGSVGISDILAAIEANRGINLCIHRTALPRPTSSG